MRIAHTMLRVRDLEASLAFYCGFLGLQQTGRREIGDEATLVFLADDSGRELLELTFNKDGRDYEPGNQFGHVAFLTADLDAVVAEVERRGWWYRRSPRPGRYIFIKDPDGYDIEILQARTGGD